MYEDIYTALGAFAPGAPTWSHNNSLTRPARQPPEMPDDMGSGVAASTVTSSGLYITVSLTVMLVLLVLCAVCACMRCAKYSQALTHRPRPRHPTLAKPC